MCTGTLPVLLPEPPMPATTLPPLPSTTFSLLGDVDVARLPAGYVDEDIPHDKQLFGRHKSAARVIEVSSDLSSVEEWKTLWHEVGHLVLFDCGTTNLLTEKQEESVCDAFGTFLTGMMLAGRLSLTR
jgi:hypothetical protein